MKTLFVKTLLLSTLYSTAFVSAAVAGRDGGGGKGVVCRDLKGEIKSVELLDLWEARMIFGRTITPIAPDKSVQSIVDDGMTALATSLVQSSQVTNASGTLSKRDSLKWNLSWIARMFLEASPNLRFVSNANLTLTDDSYEVAKPIEKSGCKIEQIVTYQDNVGRPLVYVDNDIYQKMSNVNRAALILHESFYGVLRSENNDLSSVRARRAIGYVMSGGTFESLEDYIANQSDVIKCSSKHYGAGAPTVLYVVKTLIGGQLRVVIAPQVINRVNFIGFDHNQLLMSTFYKQPAKGKAPHLVYGGYYTFWDSPVDFDLQAYIIVDLVGKPKASVKLTNVPSLGLIAPKTFDHSIWENLEDLDCEPVR